MNYEKRQSFISGIRAEARFQRWLESQNYEYRASSAIEDPTQHWDFEYYTIDGDFKVDVKGRKPNRDKDDHCWVELKNVQGRDGWIDGMADQFAFAITDYFILVNKDDLKALIDKKVKDKKVYKTKGWYKIYQRDGRLDQIVKVPTVDLIFIGKLIKA